MARTAYLIFLILLCTACAGPSLPPPKLSDTISRELQAVAEHKNKRQEDAVIRAALLPPLRAEMPKSGVQQVEPRFDLAVSNAPAIQVFMAIVSGTRYSMLVHPQVTGSVSVNLKDVTVPEALSSLRDLYGYEYRMDGTRVFIEPMTIQTRIFTVNYLVGQRSGRTDVRVTSGSIADAPTSGGSGTTGSNTTTTATPNTAGAATAGLSDSSRIQTQTSNDFWVDLRNTLVSIVGNDAGRNVIVNPQAGVIVARALPGELRNVEKYLRAIKLSVERQVMLEAKIIEVTLKQQYQAGVNWAAFPSHAASAGFVNPGTGLATSGSLANGSLTVDPGTASLSVAASAGALLTGVPGAALFGLALQTQNFAALLSFLESQGTVQVLSSPRIATLNNQKAVLKVGTDEYFLTNISGGNTTSGSTTGTTQSFPSLTLRPFFSGVALDVTPQIDQDSNIILHVHPSVSDVQTDNRTINLGTVFGGNINLPLARSTVSETDSIVKAQDGNIVAIGGLMKIDEIDNRSGVPGAQDSAVGGLFRNAQRTMVKKELVILIKPTVIQSGDDPEDVRQARDRIMNMSAPAITSGSN